jgi:hypothetical protein
VLGSLLVMPVHSLDTTTHQWDSEEYAEYIASIRHRFSSVVICVHPFCKQKGYWYPAFERRGFRIVEGALGSDSNSWERLRLLFESFEFVTTNGYGSHFVYAAYFGAKPSICGPYAQVRAEDFRDSPLYQDVPEILEPMLEACSEEVVRKDYPFLFVEPQKATTHISWAEQEVGADCRVSPAELRALFKWTLAHRLRASIGQSIRRAHRLPRRLSQRLRAFAGNNA